MSEDSNLKTSLTASGSSSSLSSSLLPSFESDSIERFLSLWLMYRDRRKETCSLFPALILRSLQYLCKCEEILKYQFALDLQSTQLESILSLNQLVTKNLDDHTAILIEEIFSNTSKEAPSKTNKTASLLKAPSTPIDINFFKKWLPTNLFGFEVASNCSSSIYTTTDPRNREYGNSYVFSKSTSPTLTTAIPPNTTYHNPSVTLSSNADFKHQQHVNIVSNHDYVHGGLASLAGKASLSKGSETTNNIHCFPRKKQRNYIYCRNDYLPSTSQSTTTSTNQNTSEQETSTDFSTALAKYEEEQIKNGKLPNLPPPNSHLLKRRKRNFQSPLLGNDDQEQQHDDMKSNLTMNKAGTPSTAQSEFKGVDQEIAERVLNEIVDVNLNVHWDDISGLENVKQILYEMVILPNLHPEMFHGLRTPPRGLLLFGPPGNGKTMIAKAIATEANLTFFSISASVLCSKWIGEGEKTMRALFCIARAKAPSFIFIDEIDSILCSRSSEEHESSRRLKNEFLLQFDGATTSSDVPVIVMGATNRPFDLDDAARRRLPKRIYIPLPEKKTRGRLLENLLRNETHCLTPEEIDETSKMLQGYSCSDIQQISQHAAMGPIRDMLRGGITSSSIGQEVVRPISYADFTKAIEMNRPSLAPEDCESYQEFARKFGTGGI